MNLQIFEKSLATPDIMTSQMAMILVQTSHLRTIKDRGFILYNRHVKLKTLRGPQKEFLCQKSCLRAAVKKIIDLTFITEAFQSNF